MLTGFVNRKKVVALAWLLLTPVLLFLLAFSILPVAQATQRGLTAGDAEIGSGAADLNVESSAPLTVTFTLQMLHASDLEGGVEAIENAPNFATIVDEFESVTGTYDASIILSAGDNYIPGPFFNAAGDRTVFRDGDVFNDTYNTLFNTTEYDSLREGSGRVDVSIMNVIGFDASAVGNHEFDQGPDAFESIIEEDFRDPAGPASDRWVGSQFPYLSANFDFTNDGDLGNLFTDTLQLSTEFQTGPAQSTAGNSGVFKIAPYTVISVDGEYIGVIGATTQLLESISSPGNVTSTSGNTNDMAALAAVLNPQIATLQLGLDGTGSTADDIDKIILVSHLQQIALEEALIGLLNGVDIVVAGGSDTLLADGTDVLRTGDTAEGAYPLITTNLDGDPAVIVSTAGEYSYVGRLVVGFDDLGILDTSSISETISGVYATDEAGVIAVTGEVDASTAISASVKGTEVQKLTDAVSGVVVAKDGNILGQTGVFIEGRREFVRTQETNMGNLTADANLAVAQAYDSAVVVSIKNGGGVRAEMGNIDGLTGDQLPPQANPASGKLTGDISQLDVENTLRFNNGLTIMDVTVEELERLLEHGVAATDAASSNTPGQFPQVGGVRFSFDPAEIAITFSPTSGMVITEGQRIRSIALIDSMGSVTHVLMENGEFVANPNMTVRIVTLDFLAGIFSDPGDPFGGDGYPFPLYGENVIQMGDVLTDTGSATFADPGSEQDALAEYLLANYSTVPYYTSEVGMMYDMRIQNLAQNGGIDRVTNDVATEELLVTNLGKLDLDGAEIAAFDPSSDRLFVTYGDGLQIVDFSDPAMPTVTAVITPSANGTNSDDVTSVAVGSGDTAGWVAIAVPNDTGTDAGTVQFYSAADGAFQGSVTVGVLPDMVTYSPDGMYVLSANEGQSAGEENEPDILPNPNGGVSIIEVNTSDVSSSTVSTFEFTDPSITFTSLMTIGVRVNMNAPSAAADLEPEYIAMDGNTAYITLQENNAVAVISDITSFSGFTIDDILPLGLKDHTLPFNTLDPSNRDGGIFLQNAPFHGMYMPDAISAYDVSGTGYFVIANEGDGRDVDESRGGDYTSADLDPEVFLITNTANITDDAVFGRIKTSNVDGDTDSDGDIDQLQTFGARSFSIFDENGNLVFDSGDIFARVTAAETPELFNANDGIADEFDDRSDDKGMEPEGVTLGTIGAYTYAFVGLERAGGGVMIFNITDPMDVQFVDYIRVEGDISPEGLAFIPAADSPNGADLLVVTHEESNNIRVFQLNFAPYKVYMPLVLD